MCGRNTRTILRPSITSTYKGLTRIGQLSCGLIAQLGEHCTGIAEVVGSNPAQSLIFFSGLCSSSVAAALALMIVITQLLLMDKIHFMEKRAENTMHS